MGMRIIIGPSERDINNIDPNWINEQVKRRRNEGVPVCIRILIDEGNINLSLATSDYPSSRGPRRTLTRAENEVLSLREKLHLNESNFLSGNLVALIKQLRV